MAEPNLIYKVSVLGLLNESQEALSNAQIVQLFIDKEYTDYFTIQQVIGELIDSNLIVGDTIHNNTTYSLSDEGLTTYKLMQDKLTPGIREDIADYLAQNKLAIEENNSLTAYYDKSPDGGYIAHCKYTSGGNTVLDLHMRASNQAQADTICNNWKARYEDIYFHLIDTLIQ
ncbi:MAG: DUF4364 family protein [Lachnospiraceae bacterium]|jgi:hypothetical protein|nr:DUF4364 family protein [Lachnospiraceae bacterium]MBQ4300818.1 DUF4364 family protein [Lachnospiraceae bacterium]